MLKTPRASRACVCMYVCMCAVKETAVCGSVCMCAVKETAGLCHSLTEMQNMQDSYLNSLFAA